jgi:hypothetical protein
MRKEEQSEKEAGCVACVRVSYRGHVLKVDKDSLLDPCIGALKGKLQELTGVDKDGQKLIRAGKILEDDDEVSTTEVLQLVGSTREEVEQLLEAEKAPKPRIRNDLSPSERVGYKRVPLNHHLPSSSSSPYKFERIETLNLPDQARAQEILEELARDRGIQKVLEKHKWSVGCLAEMYPEGAVGVSDVCVMGLNVNKGQKILLRIRTDDLLGFRKMLSIRKVLYHELAHNVWSDHDDNFHMLMRQIEAEAHNLDFKNHGGRVLSSERAVSTSGHESDKEGYIYVKESFEGGSGRLGGDLHTPPSSAAAREIAAAAALNRADKAGQPSKAVEPRVQPMDTREKTELPLQPMDVVQGGADNLALHLSGERQSVWDPPPPPEKFSAPCSQLVVMGFEEQEAIGALERAEGDVNAAVQLLLAGPSGEQVPLPVRSSREDRLIASVALVADGTAAELRLKTLHSLIQAVLDKPFDDKVKRVRLANQRFRNVVGSSAAAMEVLAAAGWEQDSEGLNLVYSRNDPGLLWLAKELLQAKMQ